MNDPIPPRHRKKQRKSKSKPTETEVPAETSKQFAKRELASNWKKYEDNTPTKDVDAAPNASDFEKILSAPASVGGHFQFKSEKSWEGNDDWCNRDDYFQLNLLELSNSLATIPFYERQNYPQDIFSSQEIEDMNRQAKFQYFKWSANCKNKLGKTSSLVDGEGKMNDTPTVENLPQNDEDDLDELLNLPGPRQPAIRSSEIPSITTTINSVTLPSGQTTSSAAVDSADDIQKWLDDVLVLDS